MFDDDDDNNNNSEGEKEIHLYCGKRSERTGTERLGREEHCERAKHAASDQRGRGQLLGSFRLG
jgi:hypothetical protein